MPEFAPLDGLEYDTAVAGPLGSLIAPPYDAISRAQRAELAALSPHNIVHVTLSEPSGGLDRYEAAGRLVSEWRESGVLAPGGRAFYLLSQSFRLHGASLTRTAVIGQVRLGPWRLPSRK